MLDHIVFDLLENGAIIVDTDLNVFLWNKWLEVNSLIQKKDIENKNLEVFFKQKFKALRRKIKICLKLNKPTFMDAKVNRYLIPIEKSNIVNSCYEYMQQNVIIKPLTDNKVLILIYDITSLLDAEMTINKQLGIFERLATIDTLTGLYNRQKFNEIISSEVKRASRYDRLLSLIMFDIDHFKKVNDTYGHLVGDEVLKKVTSLVKASIRENDFLARWGGEEFVILLPETEIEGAKSLAEKLRTVLADAMHEGVGHKTCSFGVAQLHSTGDALLKDADDALYFIKENGRNGVGFFDGTFFKRYISS